MGNKEIKIDLICVRPLIWICFLLPFFMISSCGTDHGISDEPVSVSGIYPHLAVYNDEDECGIGAVVPWAGSLWAITYGPHLPEGSSDKLYEITPALEQNIHEESIGGTPANRMIHEESRQLFIGPYVIDRRGEVRVIPYSKQTGRLTGNARHLTDPENKIYFATMEEGFYEVDVQSLEVHTLFPDARTLANQGKSELAGALLPGAHGKGLYSGQGVLVYSNNGESGREALIHPDIESGVLAEWDGKDWKVIRRNQFVEVTGPGGIRGNADPINDPIWVTGWDHRSLLIGVRDEGDWQFYRLPKASYSYDGAHGWNTEWPRIRDVGPPGSPGYMMTMHGMFWSFPANFSHATSAGIRPRSAYLKVIGDFTRWDDRLVMACDDAARKEFLNSRTIKGSIAGPGQSNSNLWFISPETPDELGPPTASGSIWLEDSVAAGSASEPFLFTGWIFRNLWLKNHGKQSVVISMEVDRNGSGGWVPLRELSLKAGQSAYIRFTDQEKGEWIRLVPGSDAEMTAMFSYTGVELRSTQPDPIFRGLAPVAREECSEGLLYATGDNRKAMGISIRSGEDSAGYYELDEKLSLVPVSDAEMKDYIQTQLGIPRQVVTVDSSSVLVIDDRGRRWRFPLGNKAFTPLTDSGKTRICREVVTERDLLNLHGTFYELPAENAGGFARVRPIASHDFRIHDYASYRGMLVMTGIDPVLGENNPHVVVSSDKKAAVWTGVIDDLWKLGKPRGKGGPWHHTKVAAGEISDPYLIGFYDRKTLSIMHDADEDISFRIEVDPDGSGKWMLFREVAVEPWLTYYFVFPNGFSARWIRFIAGQECVVTTILDYQ